MSSIREAAERDRITVKIHNMKRSTSRDSPPKLKRSRVGMDRYDDHHHHHHHPMVDRLSPERLRRRMGRSPSPRPRYVSPHRDEYMRLPPRDMPPERGHPYKVLCVSGLHPKASDEFIKETLYREYKKFGELSIRIGYDLDERVAYVCFRISDDAREARHAKPRIMFYDKMAIAEPVYETERPEYKYKHRSITPPDYDRVAAAYYGGAMPERRPRAPPIDPYDRYGPPHGSMHHPRDFRAPMHHDYIPRGPSLHHGPPNMHGPHSHSQYSYYPQRQVPHARQNHGHEGNSGGGGGGGAGGGGGGGGGGGSGAGGGNNNANNNSGGRKEKFPNYLHHILPEEDARATRTLFAGNLEININEEELRRLFGKYGILEDIDIKRPPPGTGNAYAFIKYQNLDMAHRAKIELSGQYVGKFQCKIGYGKANPATRIWVGGLGAWTSMAHLEREFDRFGVIKKIEYVKGDICAYINFESIEAAQEAVKEMRGFPLGGPEHRLRTDFAELPSENAATKVRSGYDENEYRRHYDGYGYDAYESYPPRGGGYRGRGGGGGGGGRDRGRGGPYRSGNNFNHDRAAHVDDEYRRGGGGIGGNGNNGLVPDGEYEGRTRRSIPRDASANHRSRSRSRHRTPESDSDSSSRRAGLLGGARTLSEVSRKSTTLWTGALILKSSLFPAKFHLTEGDQEIVDSLMKNEEGKHHLRITQRLRLDPPKLDDVHKRIGTSTSHAIFLGLPGSTSISYIEDASIQMRPLRNLVSYLKQKEAAGVLPLLNKSTESTGVLYAFPPCDFSRELLKKSCQSLSEDALKEDHLVVVVVRGGTPAEN